jgi:hypothetical protein
MCSPKQPFPTPSSADPAKWRSPAVCPGGCAASSSSTSTATGSALSTRATAATRCSRLWIHRWSCRRANSPERPPVPSPLRTFVAAKTPPVRSHRTAATSSRTERLSPAGVARVRSGMSSPSGSPPTRGGSGGDPVSSSSAPAAATKTASTASARLRIKVDRPTGAECMPPKQSQSGRSQRLRDRPIATAISPAGRERGRHPDGRWARRRAARPRQARSRMLATSRHPSRAITPRNGVAPQVFATPARVGLTATARAAAMHCRARAARWWRS